VVLVHQRYRDGQTTCDCKTALCTIVHRAVKTSKCQRSEFHNERSHIGPTCAATEKRFKEHVCTRENMSVCLSVTSCTLESKNFWSISLYFYTSFVRNSAFTLATCCSTSFVAELVFAMYFNGTVHTSNKLSNKLWHIFVLMKSVRCCYVPRRLVAAHVASVKGLGHKLSNKFGNLCPSPFTLATSAATCCRTCSATCGQCESTRYNMFTKLNDNCIFISKHLQVSCTRVHQKSEVMGCIPHRHTEILLPVKKTPVNSLLNYYVFYSKCIKP